MNGGARLTLPVSEYDRVREAADAPVTLVEYGDYYGPYTVRAYSRVRGLQKRLGDRMRFGFRAFPLTESTSSRQFRKLVRSWRRPSHERRSIYDQKSLPLGEDNSLL